MLVLSIVMTYSSTVHTYSELTQVCATVFLYPLFCVISNIFLAHVFISCAQC